MSLDYLSTLSFVPLCKLLTVNFIIALYGIAPLFFWCVKVPSQFAGYYSICVPSNTDNMLFLEVGIIEIESLGRRGHVQKF